MKTTTKLFISAAMALLASTLTGCEQIDTGNVGVVSTFGKVSPDPLPRGVYETLTKTVNEYTAKEIAFSIQDQKPKSRDNLTMQDVDVDFYYRITPEKIPALVVKYQGDVVRHSDIDARGTRDLVAGFNRVLREARVQLNSEFATFDATTMHTQRAEIAAGIQKRLQDQLNASDPGVFTITGVDVRNMVTDPKIETAIREKAEVDLKIDKARKEVELAAATAERDKTTAQGQAAANEILAASITDRLLDLKRIEAGKEVALQIASKAGNTVLLGGEGLPLVNTK